MNVSATASTSRKSFLLRPDNDGGDPAKHEKFVEYTKSWLRPVGRAHPDLFRVGHRLCPAIGLDARPDRPEGDGGLCPSAADAYHRRLMDVYAAENRTISDAAVLADLAADVGVDAGGFIRHLVENERVYAAAVIDEHNAAIEQGVTAVPTIVLDDVLPVQGAQDLESYERWIDRLLERRGT